MILCLEEEEDPNRTRDISGFYRGILNTVDNRHSPLILGDKSMSITIEQPTSTPIPSSVKLNDNNEIIDKRELLTGGLNLSSKTVKRIAEQKAEAEQAVIDNKARRRAEDEARIENAKDRAVQRQQQERSRVSLQKQREDVDLSHAKARKVDDAAVAAKLRTAVTGETVSDAKERYLARKAAAKEQG